MKVCPNCNFWQFKASLPTVHRLDQTLVPLYVLDVNTESLNDENTRITCAKCGTETAIKDLSELKPAQIKGTTA